MAVNFNPNLNSTVKTQLTPELYQYAINNSVYRNDILENLLEVTQKHPNSKMATNPDQAQFMAQLALISNVKRYLEVGVFTGYNVLKMALTIKDIEIYALDNDSQIINDIAKKFWTNAGVDAKITEVIDDAVVSLKKLCEDSKNWGSFDMAFIDANKRDYPVYYELCYKLVKPHGIIMIDNTFMHGLVLDPNQDQPKYVSAVDELNKKLQTDNRVYISMLPIHDGLTIIYKK